MAYTPPSSTTLVLRLRAGYSPPASNALVLDLAPRSTAEGFVATKFGVPSRVVNSGWQATVFGTPGAAFNQFGQASGIAPVAFGVGRTVSIQPVSGQMGGQPSFGMPIFPIGGAYGWMPTLFGTAEAKPTVSALAVGFTNTAFGGARVGAVCQVGGNPPDVKFGKPALDIGSSWLATTFGAPRLITYTLASSFSNQALFGTPSVERSYSASSLGAITTFGAVGFPTYQEVFTQGWATLSFGDIFASKSQRVSSFIAPALFGQPNSRRDQIAGSFSAPAFFGMPNSRRDQIAGGFRSTVFGIPEKEYVDTFTERYFDTVTVLQRTQEVYLQ